MDEMDSINHSNGFNDFIVNWDGFILLNVVGPIDLKSFQSFNHCQLQLAAFPEECSPTTLVTLIGKWHDR